MSGRAELRAVVLAGLLSLSCVNLGQPDNLKCETPQCRAVAVTPGVDAAAVAGPDAPAADLASERAPTPGDAASLPVDAVAVVDRAADSPDARRDVDAPATEVQPPDAADGTPPVLHWAFDEDSGTVALDSSPSGLSGTYVGASGTPVPSALVPATMFPDPRSRQFTMANRHAAWLPNMPAALKPVSALTVTAWYRATATDTSGSEVVSGGNVYLLRLRPTQLEFSKRVAGSAAQPYLQCLVTAPNQLDGNWHHLAGVTSAAGHKLYFDGVERCSNPSGADILYDQGSDFWVGRHGSGAVTWDFDGNIDDVRVYDRALTAAEVMRLAQGGP